jgi:serine/threonine protein phosphatase PrpC
VTDAETISWAAASRSGSRKETNDDSWIVFSSNPGGVERLAETGERSVSEHDLVFAISDGMGGGNAGDLASSLILERMAAIIPETFRSAAAGFFPDSISLLQSALKDIHEHINAVGEDVEKRRGMAATLALAWFSPENLYLANVGDSRIYRCRDGVTEQLSKDHSIAWGQLKRGEISEIEYRTHPRRAALYEIIGGRHQTINPHFAAVPYQRHDVFLVCSDGLVDGVWDRQIASALAAAGTPQECCDSLLAKAMENSGRDDTTLIVICAM